MQSSLQQTSRPFARFQVPQDSVILDRRGPVGQPLDDPAAAVAAALSSPLEFPPLAQAITTDDHVALALGPGVPQADAIVAGVVYALTEAGIAAENISIVLDQEEAKIKGRDVASGLPPALRSAIRVEAHDPVDRTGLTYLAANEAGEAIYFHRTLGEADLVIPISCLRGDGVLGHHGLHSELYPTFADEAAQQRYHALSSHQNSNHRQQRENEASEANWLLGVMLSIGVLPGANEEVQEVLVGERSAVAERAKQLCQQAWAFDVNERADLAIATIEGGPEQQTWENVGRALHAASQVVAGEGAIVVCCDLALPPGPSLQRLAADQTSEEALNELRADHFPDTLTAAQFVDMTENFRVYLRSRLDSDVVESLGIAYVSCDEEITRLSSRHNKCALIGNAHFAVPCPTA